jgi:hypothetical protein
VTVAESLDAQWQKIIDDSIRQATEYVAYEVERDAEQKVAAILRERGWTVLPPESTESESPDHLQSAEANESPAPSREQVVNFLHRVIPSLHEPLTTKIAEEWADEWLALFEKGAEARREATHDHKPVQHRDGKEPWCKVCGLNRNHEEPHSRLGRATPGGDS